ncbi:ATP-binding cassette sub-family A member 17-like [Varroa jacobsoni]|uniref:ATP-binding cassette sub-family A member 17-like n=1 Tax=Varroa jacobsoni TaxID=62625 RepID=UPI000BF4848D|nr:ATP-binding cassette sub-family A member 17-like [Varroa jacobsoni]
MMVFTMALVSFALLLTVPFTSPKIMAVVAFVVFIMSLLAINITNGYLDTNTESISDYMSLTIAFKLGTSCVPAMGINWLLKFAMFAEHKGEGLRWHNMLKGVVPGDNIAPIDVVYAMLLSWFLYLAFAVYFDSICPWQSGVPNHPLFFLQPSYWLPVVHDISETTLSSGTKELMEPVSTERRVVIRLWKISHSFGPIRALNDLSFDLYCNEITMLLGHNGAGKTTIMNILTGLILPDHGEVYINGYNVKKNTREARKSIGVCPQHNVLFDDLTVAEHLAFFAKLKDAKADVVKQETEELLLKLNLMHKCGSLSKDLSAEMRRKLCLANALIGGSEILILDEPTTGMDSESRRAVWEILQSERRSRTIVMTTHFMEEADILGDRIVFVAKGRLLACGSPMFLKRKFETGYNLRLGKRFVDVDTSRVVYAMRKALPGYDRISMDMDFGFEFVINIGFPSPQQLVELFRYLEENMTAFGVQNISISITTMEDVFHKIGAYDEAKSGYGARPNNEETVEITFREAFRHPTVIPEGRRLNTVRLCALLRKRWLVTRREWRIVFYVGLVPALATVLYCISTVAVFKNELRRSITYSIPKITSEPIGFVTERQDAVIARFADALKSKHAKVNVIQQSTNISHYLLAMASSDPRSYRNRWVAGGEFDGENRVLWYNGEPYHVGAAALALWQSSILVEATRDPNATVIVTNVYPTKAEEYLLHALFLQTFTRMMAVLFLTFAVSYPACNAVTLPIEERVLKLKLVQIMTGLPRWIYVASNAIFDFCVTLVTATIIVVLIVLMGPPNVFGEMQNLAALIVLLIIYYLAKLPTVYILTYVINRLLKFHVAKATLRWSAVFERIMQMRNDPTLSIEDVQVSDTSLEEVFLTFARKRDFTLGAITNQRTEDMSKGKPRPSKTDETEWSEAERESTREDRSNSDFPDTVTIEPFLESSSPSTPEDEQLSTSRINEMYSQSPSRLISSGLKEGQSLLTSMEARDMVDNEIKSSSLDIRPPYFRRREPKLKTVHNKKRRPRESTGRSQERHDQDHDSLILHPISPFKINDDDNMRSSLSLSMTQRGSKSFHARSPHLHNTDDAFMDQDTDSSTSSSLLSNNIGQQRTHLPISYGAD